MKIICSLVLAVAIFGFTNTFETNVSEKHVQLQGMFEDMINKTLTSILDGLPEIIKIPELSIPLPEEGPLVGSVNITNLNIQGLKEIVASYIKVNILSMALNMTLQVPLININLGYSADVTVLDLVPLYGSGKMNINIENIVLGVAGGVNFTGGLALKNVNVGVGVGDAVFDLHGLINNEDFSNIVSSILTDVVAPFINDNAELITKVISPLAQMIINSILKPNSTQEFFESEMEYIVNQIVV